MNTEIDKELNSLLETDSDFIEELSRELENEGIHLSNDLLSNILTSYEARKIYIVKGLLDNLMMGFDDFSFPLDPPPMVDVTPLRRQSSQEKKDDSFSKLDTDVIM